MMTEDGPKREPRGRARDRLAQLFRSGPPPAA